MSIEDSYATFVASVPNSTEQYILIMHQAKWLSFYSRKNELATINLCKSTAYGIVLQVEFFTSAQVY